MRSLAVILFVVSAVALSFGGAEWPGMPYKEVRAFAYNERGFPDLPIVERGKLNRTVLNKEGVVLTLAQIKALVAAVTGKHPSPDWRAMCFEPRHAFVFYDAAGEPVAWVELCFECGGARARPFHQGQVYDVSALETLAAELKLPLIPK